jgi:hypothetical protein
MLSTIDHWKSQCEGQFYGSPLILILKSNMFRTNDLSTGVGTRNIAYSINIRRRRRYCNVFKRLETGFRLVIGFINNLQVVTTSSYNTLADLHNLQLLHTELFSLSPLVFMDVSHRKEITHSQYHCTVKCKVVPVLNELSTTPWRRMREWMYRSTFSWPWH